MIQTCACALYRLFTTQIQLLTAVIIEEKFTYITQETPNNLPNHTPRI